MVCDNVTNNKTLLYYTDLVQYQIAPTGVTVALLAGFWFSVSGLVNGQLPHVTGGHIQAQWTKRIDINTHFIIDEEKKKGGIQPPSVWSSIIKMWGIGTHSEGL